MSFILDALKKLERQKQEEGDSGVDETVMEGGRRWGGAKRRIELGKGGVFVAFLALIIAGFALYQSFLRAPQSEPSGSESLPSSSPVAVADTQEPDTEEPDTKEPDTEEPDTPRPTVAKTEPEPEPDLSAEDDSIDVESAPEIEIESVPPVRLVGRSSEDQPRGDENSSDGEKSEEVPDGLPELVLQGTSIVDGKPIAVINYQRLFEGDSIEGARVIKISDRIVELEYEGKRFFIKL